MDAASGFVLGLATTYVATNAADELGADKAIKKLTRKTADTVQQE